MSRFTSRPYFSVIGDPYSQRIPRFNVSDGLTRQSSIKYAAYVDQRKYLSALPYAIELVSGMPSRKPAKSLPAAAPVKLSVPRGSCCETGFACCRRYSPPIVKLCAACDQNSEGVSAWVWLRVRLLNASERVEMPLLKERLGGPQLIGSWLVPV